MENNNIVKQWFRDSSLLLNKNILESFNYLNKRQNLKLDDINLEKTYTDILSLSIYVIIYLQADKIKIIDFKEQNIAKQIYDILFRSFINNSPSEPINLYNLITIEELLDEEIIKICINNLKDMVYSQCFSSKHIGILFENFFSKKFVLTNEEIEVIDTNERKNNGVFYTDWTIIDFIIDKVLKEYENNSFDDILKLKFIDPSMGTGFFIIEMINKLAQILVQKKNISYTYAKYLIAKNCIYGVDKNPIAVSITKALVWLEVQQDNLPIDFLNQKLKVGDSLLFIPYNTLKHKIIDSGMKLNLANLIKVNKDILYNIYKEKNIIYDQNYFNWYLDYPEVFLDKSGRLLENAGFDGVLGNPPWSKIKPNKKDFYSQYARKDKQIDNLHGEQLNRYISESIAEEQWKKYKKQIKGYNLLIKELDFYSYQSHRVKDNTTGGDTDLYKLFLELSYFLLNKKGILGFVVPSSFYLNQGTTGLRHLYLENGKFRYLVNFENKKMIFPIHKSYKFCILIYAKGQETMKIENAVFNLTDPDKLLKFKSLKAIEFDREYFDTCGGDYKSISELSNSNEVELFKKLYNKYPLLGSQLDNHWNIKFNRELDMTKDSSLFYNQKHIESDNDKYIPLYEGRMVHQYDYAYKKYISGTGRRAKWKILALNEKEIIPQFYVSKDDLVKDIQLDRARACFCDVTGQFNERTVLAALIPPNTVAGNKVPTCEFTTRDIRLDLLWIGIANSFVIDWLIRKKITTTLNFFYWNQIPFPRIEVDSEIAREIILRSANLICITEDIEVIWKELLKSYDMNEVKPFIKRKSSKERGEMRAEIESIVFSLFNLSVEEVAILLYDFKILDRNQPALEQDRRYQDNKPASYITRDITIYKYIKYLGLETSINIVDLYAKSSIDIDNKIGPIRNLNDRLKEYDNLGAISFDYL